MQPPTIQNYSSLIIIYISKNNILKCSALSTHKKRQFQMTDERYM